MMDEKKGKQELPGGELEALGEYEGKNAKESFWVAMGCGYATVLLMSFHSLGLLSFGTSGDPADFIEAGFQFISNALCVAGLLLIIYLIIARKNFAYKVIVYPDKVRFFVPLQFIDLDRENISYFSFQKGKVKFGVKGKKRFVFEICGVSVNDRDKLREIFENIPEKKMEV